MQAQPLSSAAPAPQQSWKDVFAQVLDGLRILLTPEHGADKDRYRVLAVRDSGDRVVRKKVEVQTHQGTAHLKLLRNFSVPAFGCVAMRLHGCLRSFLTLETPLQKRHRFLRAHELAESAPELVAWPPPARVAWVSDLQGTAVWLTN